jgi:hydrogenase/urease accessory protein HupE
VFASKRASILPLVTMALASIAGPVWAHTGGSTGYAAILVSGGTVRYGLTLSPSAVPGPVADELARARAGSAGARDRLLASIRAKVVLHGGGTRCEPASGFIEPPRPDAESVTVVVHFACPLNIQRLHIRDDLFDVLGADHHTLAKIEAPDRTQEVTFGTESREAEVALAGTAGAMAAGPPSFFLLGVHHILSGYDHLLFLLALLLRGGSLLSLLKIITAFTVAHSLTLALAVLHVVTLPNRLVESVIAMSITLVALENLTAARPTGHRWGVSFVFGLVHGFGFAAALGPLELPRWNLAGVLLAFNLNPA